MKSPALVDRSSHAMFKHSCLLYDQLAIESLNGFTIKHFCRWNCLRFGSPSNASSWFNFDTGCHCISEDHYCTMCSYQSPIPSRSSAVERPLLSYSLDFLLLCVCVCVNYERVMYTCDQLMIQMNQITSGRKIKFKE